MLRTRTHISQTLPKDLKYKIECFRKEVKQINEYSDYPLTHICNTDETPVFLDFVPSEVVDKKGGGGYSCAHNSLWKKIVLLLLCAVQLPGSFCHHSLFLKGR